MKLPLRHDLTLPIQTRISLASLLPLMANVAPNGSCAGKKTASLVALASQSAKADNHCFYDKKDSRML